MTSKRTIDDLEKLMEQDERCRNDDIWLWYRYVRDIQDIRIFIPFQDLDRIRNPETVIRMRALIQNKYKKLLPTNPEVRRRRKISEEEWKKFVTRR